MTVSVLINGVRVPLELSPAENTIVVPLEGPAGPGALVFRVIIGWDDLDLFSPVYVGGW